MTMTVEFAPKTYSMTDDWAVVGRGAIVTFPTYNEAREYAVMANEEIDLNEYVGAWVGSLIDGLNVPAL